VRVRTNPYAGRHRRGGGWARIAAAICIHAGAATISAKRGCTTLRRSSCRRNHTAATLPSAEPRPGQGRSAPHSSVTSGRRRAPAARAKGALPVDANTRHAHGRAVRRQPARCAARLLTCTIEARSGNAIAKSLLDVGPGAGIRAAVLGDRLVPLAPVAVVAGSQESPALRNTGHRGRADVDQVREHPRPSSVLKERLIRSARWGAVSGFPAYELGPLHAHGGGLVRTEQPVLTRHVARRTSGPEDV